MSLQGLVSRAPGCILPPSLSCPVWAPRLDGLEPRPRLHLGFSAEFSGREDPVPPQLLRGLLEALGPACCSVLSELSEEQAFHVNYLDIGVAESGGRGRWGLDQSKYGWE